MEDWHSSSFEYSSRFIAKGRLQLVLNADRTSSFLNDGTLPPYPKSFITPRNHLVPIAAGWIPTSRETWRHKRRKRLSRLERETIKDRLWFVIGMDRLQWLYPHYKTTNPLRQNNTWLKRWNESKVCGFAIKDAYDVTMTPPPSMDIVRFRD